MKPEETPVKVIRHGYITLFFERLLNISFGFYEKVTVEATELITILAALSWVVPLWVVPDYLTHDGASVRLQAMAGRMAQHHWLCMFGTLFLWQVICIFAVGWQVPPKKWWVFGRVVGLVASTMVWTYIASNMYIGGVNFGAGIHSSLVLVSLIGLKYMSEAFNVLKQVNDIKRTKKEGDLLLEG
jgi:hypothetical protein